MRKPATTAYPIHDLLRERWSPRAFADRAVEPEKLGSLFEAGRWAPSSSNAQPWNFLLARRENREEFERMLSCLVEGNQVWARHAPVLMITAAELKFSWNGQANPHALHDLGQAIAGLTIQATALGLAVHQMAGIKPELARQTYYIPEGYEVVTGVALGYPGDPDELPEELRKRELAPRSRKPLESFVFGGRWRQSLSL